MTTDFDRATLSDVPFHAIVEQSVAGIYVLQDECCVYTNHTFAAIMGYTPEEMIGGHLTKFIAPHFLPEVLRLYYKRLNADPPSIHFITHLLHRDGRELLVEVHGSRILYRGRPAVIGVGIDATERLRNEEELRRSREQLQQLSAYTHRKLEEQRLSFARDVHDVLGGMLTSLKMDATRVLRRADSAELQELTRGLIALTQKTIDTVREMSEALRPSELEHLDLAAAIARELGEFSARSGVPHTLDARAPTPVRLSPKRAIALYRIFQEALTNVARHAQAARVRAALTTEGDMLMLSLEDDGLGFDPAAQGRNALGLLSMSERAREIGAEFSLDSAPGAGTRLRLRAPLL
ncbi:MAG: PAS domain-containing sensor histidine kinase [Pseudomonadota bacterium]|uniref:PAS domain-containing sensor histidine kinase n=1 Tax=Caldimonas aquatica TaxID=376175 RepID=A0ABY6MR26_9BURK|nr:PAS domain-containing sensor histidine kinase [Schlegelella aquatica]UZD54457.1 PAS domain-containing sensor histidine kinase [Schlegelella aquatica]